MRFLFKTDYRQDLRLARHPGHVFWYGLLMACLLVAPGWASSYWIAQLGFVLIYAIAGLGLMVLSGYTGLLSIGHAAFLGVGAYTQAWLTSHGVPFVPAHPVAGTENSGPEAALLDLFQGRWCILTPTDDADADAVARLTAFWEACGSTVETMDADHHDLVLAIVSHLPHIIAYNIVGTADDLEAVTKSEVIKYSASGFRDFTRLAASDPTMWRDVCLHNKDAILEMLRRPKVEGSVS